MTWAQIVASEAEAERKERIRRTPHAERSHPWRWEIADCDICQANRAAKVAREDRNDRAARRVESF